MAVQAEVGEYEPWLALDGGQADGLRSLQPICLGAACTLQPGGFLALETAGWTSVSVGTSKPKNRAVACWNICAQAMNASARAKMIWLAM